MSGFPIIDLILGMIFIYFLLSIISSSLVEIILSTFKIRSKVLSKWLLSIFDKKMMQPDGSTLTLGHAIMDHCITTGLAKPGKSTSFIDAKNFVSALLEKITFDPNKPFDTDSIYTFSDPPQNADEPADPARKTASPLDKLAACIRNAKALNGTPLLSTELQRAFLIYAAEAKEEYKASSVGTLQPAKSEMQLFRSKLETWFDSSMDRVQGHMKIRYVRRITLAVGILVVVALNADSVAIARYLYNNPDARGKIAEAAAKTAADTTFQNQVNALAANPSNAGIAEHIKDSEKKYKEALATLKDTGIPLGWDSKANSTESAATRIGGWLATVLAIMLGAPFWFDLLNKISNIRGAGQKPASSTADKPKTT